MHPGDAISARQRFVAAVSRLSARSSVTSSFVERSVVESLHGSVDSAAVLAAARADGDHRAPAARRERVSLHAESEHRAVRTRTHDLSLRRHARLDAGPLLGARALALRRDRVLLDRRRRRSRTPPVARSERAGFPRWENLFTAPVQRARTGRAATAAKARHVVADPGGICSCMIRAHETPALPCPRAPLHRIFLRVRRVLQRLRNGLPELRPRAASRSDHGHGRDGDVPGRVRPRDAGQLDRPTARPDRRPDRRRPAPRRGSYRGSGEPPRSGASAGQAPAGGAGAGATQSAARPIPAAT